MKERSELLLTEERCPKIRFFKSLTRQKHGQNMFSICFREHCDGKKKTNLLTLIIKMGPVDWPNQFQLGQVSFLTGQNIESTYFEADFSIKPKISPHMHKYVLLKSIKVLIAKCIAYICLRFAFPPAMGSDCILLDVKLEMQGCQ